MEKDESRERAAAARLMRWYGRSEAENQALFNHSAAERNTPAREFWIRVYEIVHDAPAGGLV